MSACAMALLGVSLIVKHPHAAKHSKTTQHDRIAVQSASQPMRQAKGIVIYGKEPSPVLLRDGKEVPGIISARAVIDNAMARAQAEQGAAISAFNFEAGTLP